MVLISDFILFAILASVFWAVSLVIKKDVISNRIDSSVTVALIAGVTSFLVSLSLLLTGNIAFPSLYLFGVLVFSGVLYMGGVLGLFEAMKIGEVSRLSSMTKLSSVFTLVLATIFLNEYFTLQKYAGITMIIGGAVMVSSEDFGREFFDLKANRAFWTMFVSMFSIGASWVVMKYATELSSYWNVFFWSRLGVAMTALLVLLYPPVRSPVFGVIRNFRVKRPDFIAVAEVANTSGVFLNTLALSLGPVSLVAAASSTTPLFVLSIVILLTLIKKKSFRDDIGRKPFLMKISAATMVVIGIYLIS